MRMAKVKVNSEFTAPCETSMLYPANGGNMHCFTAVTACAVLDVLGPPYSDPEGRHCTYYRDLPFTSFSVDAASSVPREEREDYARLQEREIPEDFNVVGIPYRGPIITRDN
ncbi:LOW QUALITY PROTEIN: plant cysteine oxidase 2-like [Rhodamnia argentea]|uniref:cysteine dioxygenase n=1 Tax=Rhodamnia argentea TaxID=178133 RepID=A0ABM3HUZ1_9MYRT|nr:LOW QUALITY PROTEIN: plant cysteine oxidase 2-like [Rhodamnia argentea]